MRIALLGSVTSIIPPEGQAAIERLAYWQALGLARRGHDVLLFAPLGSRVPHEKVSLVDVARTALLTGVGKEGSSEEERRFGASYKLRLEIANLAHVLDGLLLHKDEFDIILNNLRGEAVLLPVAKALGKPIYHVMHLPIFPELAELFKKYHTHLISISNAQRSANTDLSYAGTVYNAVDTNEFTFSAEAGEYLLYLGSIGRNKNPKDAVLAAKGAGIPMKIGGRIKDQAYYEAEIAPLIDGRLVQWVGEQHPETIVALYQHARALLFPTLWEEPFGLVMIEALSCGTPVIAYPHGAVPEVIEDGKNGFLVGSVNEMIEKIRVIDRIDRAACRASVEEKFTVDRMIDSYETILAK